MSSPLRSFASAAVAVVAAGFAPHAAAEKPYDADRGWSYMGGSGYYLKADSKRNADDGWGSRGFVGARLPGGLRVEAAVFGQKASRDIGSGKDTALGIGGDFLLPLTSGGSSPFIIAGGGYTREKVQGDREGTGYAEAGVGMLFPLTYFLQLRAEGRYVAVFGGFGSTDGTDPLYDAQVSLGLQAELGRPRRRVIDRDHDGVPE